MASNKGNVVNGPNDETKSTDQLTTNGNETTLKLSSTLQRKDFKVDREDSFDVRFRSSVLILQDLNSVGTETLHDFEEKQNNKPTNNQKQKAIPRRANSQQWCSGFI